MKNKILIVAAHPDDEVLGCGATILKMVKSGYEAHLLILGEGKTSRSVSGLGNFKQDLEELNKETMNSCKVLGISSFENAGFPDNKFDSLALLDIVQKIEEVKNKIRPDIIFTHHFGDINIDHQVTHRAVLTATRPMRDECVKEVYSFEVASSTEWNSYSRENIFIPNVFVEVENEIDDKVLAMDQYCSELREYPHPRSLQYIKEMAKNNGVRVGLKYSENFCLIRSVNKI